MGVLGWEVAKAGSGSSKLITSLGGACELSPWGGGGLCMAGLAGEEVTWAVGRQSGSQISFLPFFLWLWRRGQWGGVGSVLHQETEHHLPLCVQGQVGWRSLEEDGPIWCCQYGELPPISGRKGSL